jgi:glucose-1-phosphatase
MPKPIDALLFDLGRVLIDIDMTRIHDVWAAQAGVPVERLHRRHAEVVSSDIFHGHERGTVSDAAFFAHLRRTLDIDISDAQFLEGWNAIFIGEMSGIRDCLARVRGRLPLYVFSNTNAPHVAHWSMHFADLLQPFDKVYISNTLGHRKPEAAAFAAVVADMGVPAERVLFFDDVADNVRGAKACGVNAVQVASAVQIEQALKCYGI